MTDDEWIPIRFTDEYRKAKRNSLVWSALTLAVGMGQSQTGSETVRLLGTSLTYDQSFVGLAFLCVATFMFFGFLREDRSVRLSNKELFIAENVASLGEAIEVLSGKVASWERSLAENFARMEATAKTYLQREKSFREKLAVLKNVESVTGWQYSGFLKDVELISLDMKPEDAKKILTKNLSNIREMRSILFEINDGLVTELDEMRAQIVSESAELSRSFTSQEGMSRNAAIPIYKVAEQLKGFHQEVRMADRSWRVIHDLVPTILLYGIAFLSVSFADQFQKHVAWLNLASSY